MDAVTVRRGPSQGWRVQSRGRGRSIKKNQRGAGNERQLKRKKIIGKEGAWGQKRKKAKKPMRTWEEEDIDAPQRHKPAANHFLEGVDRGTEKKEWLGSRQREVVK